MNDWFTWNGVDCTTYGMHVLAQPPVMRPTERVQYVTVPGRSDSLTLLEGANVFESITLPCTCIIEDPYQIIEGSSVSRIRRITGWLNGDGVVIFANQPEGFYKARIANQMSFDQIVRGNPYRSFQVQFRCSPIFFLTSGLDPVTLESPATSVLLSNLGNIPSKPLLRVEGTGEGAIMCGNSTVLLNDFTGVDYIMLDCDAEIAYKGTLGDPLDPLVLLGSRVSGDWLTIPTGDQYITKTGAITSVEIVPRWGCI